jgi:hypothetical protein
MERLAQAWGADLWNYRHGHISVMNARGLTPKVHDWLLRPHQTVIGRSVSATVAGEAMAAS